MSVKVVKGANVERLTVLPPANRRDPQVCTGSKHAFVDINFFLLLQLLPPPISEQDAQRGILSLLERGLVPPAAELHLDPSPVRHNVAQLFPAEKKALDKTPASAVVST